ncbi:MAG: hypothetical protein ACK56F_25180, partial [bacterium]
LGAVPRADALHELDAVLVRDVDVGFLVGLAPLEDHAVEDAAGALAHPLEAHLLRRRLVQHAQRRLRPPLVHHRLGSELRRRGVGRADGGVGVVGEAARHRDGVLDDRDRILLLQ